MNEEVTKLSPKSLTHLFLALSRAKSKIHEKEKKREALLGSIEKIRRVSEGTAKKSAILAELQKLESQVHFLVEKHAEEAEMLKRLQQKYELPKPKVFVRSAEDIERASIRLNENLQKLNKVEEEPKIEIVTMPKEEKVNVREIESQLSMVEKRYLKLKKSNQNPADMKRLKEMIDKYKKMIFEIKSSK